MAKININKSNDYKNIEEVVLLSINKWVSSSYEFPKFLKFYKSCESSNKHIGNAICLYLDNIKPNSKLGEKIPKLIIRCAEYFDQDTKSKILYKILKKKNNFYFYAKKLLLKSAFKLANSNSELIDILDAFLSIIKKDDLFKIINKVDSGFNNKEIKKIFKRTNKFNIFKYKKEEVKTNSKKRIELLKTIAKLPSSAKNLDFAIKFTKKDLEALSPIMRFNLFKWYYEPKFRVARYYYNKPNLYITNINKVFKETKTNKIFLPSLSEHTLSNLLFSVGLKKNDEVVSFINKYKVFKKIENGFFITEEEIYRVFGGKYFLLYDYT